MTSRTVSASVSTVSLAVLASVLSVSFSVFAAPPSGRAAKPEIVLAPSPTPEATFEVRGLPPDALNSLRAFAEGDTRWADVFAVFVVPQGTPSALAAIHVAARAPAMLGEHGVAGDIVRFTPRFPLERGLQYVAVFEWPTSPGQPKHSLSLVRLFAIPPVKSAPTHLIAFYPSGNELPENLLRVYLQFSAPMSQGGSYAFIRLRDDSTGKIGPSFLELPQELWSVDGKRLTLLLDPGRVKQGLKPREELGPVLQAGRRYTLLIDSKWPDARGRPLAEPAKKTFLVQSPETSRIDPRTWVIEPPHGGTREPLRIRFPKPLDHALLERLLRVQQYKEISATRLEKPGTIAITDGETRWSFTPEQDWYAGHYAVAVSKNLEDRSGNSIAGPFEVDINMNNPPPPTMIPSVMLLNFDVD